MTLTLIRKTRHWTRIDIDDPSRADLRSALQKYRSGELCAVQIRSGDATARLLNYESNLGFVMSIGYRGEPCTKTFIRRSPGALVRIVFSYFPVETAAQGSSPHESF